MHESKAPARGANPQAGAADLFDLAPVGYFVVDREGLLLRVNMCGVRLLGRAPEQLTGTLILDHVLPADHQVVRNCLASSPDCGIDSVREVRLSHPSRNVRYVRLFSRQIADGQCLLVAIDANGSDRLLASDRLRLAAMVYESSNEAMMVTDIGNQIIAINRAFTRLTGYTEQEIAGKTPALLLSRQLPEKQQQDILHTIASAGSWQGEIQARHHDGKELLLRASLNTAFNDDGSPHLHVVLFTDISEQKKNEELIWQQANFDFLTGKPNRRMFSERLRQEVQKAAREHGLLAVLFIDLDRFKEVNDSLGHDMGDELLRQAANRLQESIRDSDFLARLGGDEFAIILLNLDTPSSIDKIAQKILLAVARPFLLDGHQAHVSASIGISLFPTDTGRVENLLSNADQAMYSAKHLGRNRFCYFTPEMQEAAQRRMDMANDLRMAVTLNQLRLYYQPVVDLRTGAIHKAEALIRWEHPETGLIAPAEFIHIAEETGLIIDIGNWVFEEAARQVTHWRERFGEDFQISINKSPVQFRDNPLGDWLAKLKALDLDTRSISVEITEGLLLDIASENIQRFHAWHNAGVQMALDDFGTGYSSLSHLKKFDIDYLKIDRSFTENLVTEPEDMVMCEAIIVMAHKLRLTVVAEGIETAAQRDLLLKAGCDLGQGYLFSAPVPAAEFEALMESWPAA